MELKKYRIFCTVLCCAPLLASAQTYSSVVEEGKRLEAEYQKVCTAYLQKNPQSVELMQKFLKENPDTPHANRVNALMASVYFFNQQYEEALLRFDTVNLESLPTEERNDMTYRRAISLLKTGEVTEAAIWLETLRATSSKYEVDCGYYLAYVRYTQGRYAEALDGFLPLQDHPKYQALVPYYIAETYLQQKQYDKAEIVAQNYLSAYPDHEFSSEMYRVVGTAQYHSGKYHEAMKSLERYVETEEGKGAPRRDTQYLLGISRYQCGVYSLVPVALGEVVMEDDALTQNAYLHMGLAYLQLGDKNKARMAFEQAAIRNTDRHVKEQAAYNHALCIHETSYSAFGESVTVFENFMNEFPASSYLDKVSGYLVEIYMNTRSYEVALKSINRIAHPNRSILEAKQKILFQLGTQAFANTQFEQAVGYLDQSIALGQYNLQTKADALFWRGESAYRLNRMQEAEQSYLEYQSLTRQKSNQMYALSFYNLGYLAFHGKSYATAEQRFSKYIQQQQGENATVLADSYNRLGDCALQSRRFEEARQCYVQAENVSASAGDYALYQQALVAGLQKDYNGKVLLLSQLAQKYPQSPYAVNALYEKGRSYVQTENNAQAIQTFRQLLGSYPDSPISRKAAAEIGMLYYQNEEYNAAIDAYKQVITRYPGSEEARMAMRDLKSIYVDANRVNELAALADEMPGVVRFEVSEQDSLTYIAAEKIYMKGEMAQAKESMNRYLQSFPSGAFQLNAHYYLCAIAKSQQDDEAVLLHADKLLEFPDSPYSEEALLMRGEILFKQQRYADALGNYKTLQAKATTADHRQVGLLGAMRAAAQVRDDIEVVQAATSLLTEAKISPEISDEAYYYRAKAYLQQKGVKKAMADFTVLAKDTRTLYGAEAKYRLAQLFFDEGSHAAAEKEVLDFIEQSTPHTYWLARSFILLSDVYAATGKKLDARQYLLSLQQNYQAEDDIANMINERLETLK